MQTKLETMRQDAETIYRAALKASDAQEAVLRHLRVDDGTLHLGKEACQLPEDRRVWVVGAGKASAAMALAAEQVLQERVAGGLVIVKYGHGEPLQRVEVAEAAHPTPDANGQAATARLLDLVRQEVRPDDLLLVLISGGGSALLEAPAEGVTLEDLIACSSLLLASGASIQEMNAVRKHLSRVKGGFLARHAAGRETWTLLLSDVPGDTLDAIASGPTVPDSTTYQDAISILEKYGLIEKMPRAVVERLRQGAAGRFPETPKQADACFRSQHPVIVGSNALACRAAHEAATRLGYDVRVRPRIVTGDNRDFAQEEMELAARVADELKPGNKPICLLSGGETTVRLKGKGKGGRNQDLALNCVAPLARLPLPAVFVSLGTDGTDGPTDAAGAFADNRTLQRHQERSQQPLEAFVDNNDAYRFFDPLGDLIKTGPTGTNVMDVHLLLVAPA